MVGCFDYFYYYFLINSLSQNIFKITHKYTFNMYYTAINTLMMNIARHTNASTEMTKQKQQQTVIKYSKIIEH